MKLSKALLERMGLGPCGMVVIASGRVDLWNLGSRQEGVSFFFFFFFFQ